MYLKKQLLDAFNAKLLLENRALWTLNINENERILCIWKAALHSGCFQVNKSTFNVVKSRYVVYRGEDGRVVVRLASPNDQTVATSINEGSRAPSPGHPRSNVFQPVINREGVVHGGTEDGVEEALMQTGETSDESLDQFETGDLFSSSEELIFPFSNES
ncbi:unnamed protein product [Toxocara canis]|uniref:Uncharacterized protein n=1 Tax=Toxocara canis TaxID=6265 RepID=A0A183TWZ5_TOXCA|nr:unnamed protein product [Toxocara canis]